MRCITSFEFKTLYQVDWGIFNHFHEFLQANPGLEKLVVDAVVDFDESNYTHHPPAPADSLTLAHLRHLELKGILPFSIKSGKFSLPSLRILRITWLKDASAELSRILEDEGTTFAELVELTTRGRLLGRKTLTSVLLRAPKLEILNCADFDSVVAESLTEPCVAFLRDPASEDPKFLVPTKLPILCPALSVLNISQSPRLKTDPVMRIVRERIALAASQDGGKYQLPGQDGDRGVSCIRTLKVDGCPHIEADMLPWFQENVPEFSCQYELKRRR